jgi:hypothetical protein
VGERDAVKGFSRESQIRRDADGRWFDGSIAVENVAIARAFDRWIDRAEDGRYILKNAINWVYIEIDGAPIFVKSIDVQEAGIDLELSDERNEPLDGATLRLDRDGILWCDVRGGKMPAKFSRRAQQEIAPALEEDEGGIYLRIGQERVRPAIVEKQG